MDHEHSRQSGPTAIRLTFTSEDGELELVSAIRLRMRAPTGERHDTDEGNDRVGSWVEVQGPERAVLYRRRMQPVAPESIEVPDVGGMFRRVPNPGLSSVVSVVVPDVEGARRVVLRERRLGGKQRETADVVDHASVSLDQVDDHDSLGRHEQGDGGDGGDDQNHDDDGQNHGGPDEGTHPSGGD